MRFLSLIVVLVLGFLAAAWFYGAGGALMIAGKQIGPDILEQADFHSNSSGRALDGAPGETPLGGAPQAESPDQVADGGAEKASPEKPAVTKNNVPLLDGNSYIQLRWPK